MVRYKKGFGRTLAALAVLAGLSAAPVLAQDVDFGDDSSEWAKDGECDDPRFIGAGMAEELEDADLGKDASDCRTAFEAGTITLAETPASPADIAIPAVPPEPAPAADIDFGDDSSDWAKDDECDDPRFTGAGMARELEDIDTGKDATDCRAAFEAGTITLNPITVEPSEIEIPTVSGQPSEALDFGDDSSEWAKDEECDDPRFTGSGMAEVLESINAFKDATDCEAAFNAGTIELAEVQPDKGGTPVPSAALLALADRINFGDDSGDYPKDGECDDVDFVGSGMALEPVAGERLNDATDCRAAFLAGTVTLVSAGAPAAAFDYGSDYSNYANDGECDDWRFTGSAMAKKLSSEDVMADATDCRALEADGQVSIKQVYQPAYALNGPYDSSAIDFGDDSSTYAKDNVCDDPRFEGPGTASTMFDSDRMADASDCRTAYEKGTIDLKEGEA